MATEYKGQCPWGAVHFTYTYSEDTKCHCLNCRKVNGTSPPLFGIPKKAFAITKGEEELKHYDITPNFQRFFCQTCGTSMVYGGYKAPNKTASLLLQHSRTITMCFEYNFRRMYLISFRLRSRQMNCENAWWNFFQGKDVGERCEKFAPGR